MNHWWQRIISYISPTLLFARTNTVRYAFSFLLLFAVILSMAGVVSTEPAEIILETNVDLVQEGDPLTIVVYAVAHTPVNAVSLKIAFPTSLIEVTGIDRGQSVITLWTSDPRVDNGTVILEGGTYRKGFVGKHQIAIINAKAKTTGRATFVTEAASLLAGDGRGSEVATDISSNGTVGIQVASKDENIDTLTVDNVSLVIVTDLDNDGVVTLADITKFMKAWAKRDNSYDFNADGAMSFKDFSIILFGYFKQST